jgi:hypothetical protein
MLIGYARTSTVEQDAGLEAPKPICATSSNASPTTPSTGSPNCYPGTSTTSGPDWRLKAFMLNKKSAMLWNELDVAVKS